MPLFLKNLLLKLINRPTQKPQNRQVNNDPLPQLAEKKGCYINDYVAKSKKVFLFSSNLQKKYKITVHQFFHSFG